MGAGVALPAHKTNKIPIMPLTLVQKQKLAQEQVQLQSAMQVLASKLTELPLEGLRDRVANELAENPYLEASTGEHAEADLQESSDADTSYGPDGYDARQDYSSEDDIPDYLLHSSHGNADEPEGGGMESADSRSFYDQLMEQAGEYAIPDHDRQILEYIIGNLDDDGLLTKPLFQLADELSIYHYCDTSPEEVERILHILWQFDPAGVGARSLQECLIIQCKRKGHRSSPGHTTLLLKVLEQNWDEITHNRWDIISRKHDLTEQQTQQLRQDIRRLNPRPGSSMGEKASSAETHITPDIIVRVDSDGHIDLTLNDGDLPTLSVSEDAMEMMDESFVRDYVSRGRLFIGAILQRRHTIMHTMQAIIRLQRQYFLTGDDNLLRPMRLEDIASVTHQDLSTVSRVCNSKYVDTPYGIRPLKWFFSTSVKTNEEDASVRKIHGALRNLVNTEDKSRPLSDDTITELLRQQGFDVARRTVAKYREQLGIPTSRMRRE